MFDLRVWMMREDHLSKMDDNEVCPFETGGELIRVAVGLSKVKVCDDRFTNFDSFL